MSSEIPIQIPSEFFLPSENVNSALKLIASSAIGISLLHLVSVHLITSQGKRCNFTHAQAFKASYQLTNLLVNLTFGILGFYFCFVKDNDDNLAYSKLSTRGIADHVFGHEKYYIFPALQVGYNLWSLPMGLIYIKEPLPMIIHHISVIIICSLSVVSHYGFRVHTPFLTGMFEASSVPLAIVNFLNDHHEQTIKHPIANLSFTLGKVLFALMFLGIRIILGTPHMYLICNASYWATFVALAGDASGASLAHGILRGWVGVVFFAQLFMASLQYWWGYLIVKKLARMFSGGGNSKVKGKKKN